MKKEIRLFIIIILVTAAAPVFSQTYKTIADTAALNTEYAKVTNDITTLNASLSKAKDEQAKESKKATDAAADAKNTASETSDKASQANGESVKDARRAKKEARRSYMIVTANSCMFWQFNCCRFS